MRTEIRVAGVGGQGSITLAYIFGRASSLYDKRNTIMTEAYGPEITGGFSRGDLIIDDSEITYPKVDNPDYLVVMDNDGWERNGHLLKEDSTVIFDSDLVKISNPGKKYFGIPALTEALKLGKKVVANVILMGALQVLTEAVTRPALEKAMLDRVPKGAEELNLSALHRGYELGEQLKGGN